ncbi:S8 family peptidase [Bacillus glycinifermentans]|uniref:S8 family peptidase n=1 Tax=Bacillus glycinifermentans TaxID=1664069 RepID=UPI001FF4F8A5|nr:S8 family peptidase [Bacillus glycinifermentans]UOY87394.1 S8 family peptidase [Bacillus glycinifermentans]
MNDRPILIFPKPVVVNRVKKSPGRGSKVVFPQHSEQVNRISPKLQQLENTFANQRGTITTTVEGINPEYAVVFETVGTIDNFVNAVKRIEGLEWLAEIDEYIDSDDDFYIINDKNEKTEKQLSGRLFLMMSNQRAMKELKTLWDKFKNLEDFDRGYGKWKSLFKQLKDLRLWSIQDRFYKTGFLEVLEEKLAAGQEKIKFEVELWFRNSDSKRMEAALQVKNLISKTNGKVIYESVIPEISYHALLVETPINIFDELSKNSNIQLIKAESIMYFRPVGQSIVDIPLGENDQIEHYKLKEKSQQNNNKPPIVALFDGLPLQNHTLLRDSIIIDDPDGFEEDYPAEKRIHGTSMASLIVHGELDREEEPLSRKIYVRPIMKPNPNDFISNSECIPEDILQVDLIHRAVRRLFEGDSNESSVAPNIKVINLSIGDTARPFDLQLSSWAKMIDFLSFKYKVLFLISAGNNSSSLFLDIPRDEFINLKNDPIVEEKAIKFISENIIERRILSPAESINSICIGASHKDSSTVSILGHRIDIFKREYVMSPYSRVGLGFRNSIKPDILMPGGKQLFLENVLGKDGQAVLDTNTASIAPGHKVAVPGESGSLNNVAYTRGTSNATALASRLSAKIYEILEQLIIGIDDGEEILKNYGALFIKTLLVHGAQWNEAFKFYKNILHRPGDKKFRDKKLPRYIGYGFVDEDIILKSSEQRVTLLGYSTIKKEEGQLFEVPLPPSLSSTTCKRRLTITLSWFSPLSQTNQKYRKAHIWFDSENEVLQLNRLETDARAVQRGTVQHEIFEGERATAFIDGDVLKIKVNCREDANGLSAREEIPYTLAVTLEVAEGINIPIYTEVRDRLRTRIRTQV